MPDAIDDLLNDAVVRDALKQAWLDSNPGASGGHETGGFIVRDDNGIISTLRWPEGELTAIDASAHSEGKANGNVIIASFHTHPNIGADYIQEPSFADIAMVIGDDDLTSADYIGEFIVSLATIYLILPNGGYVEIGDTAQNLGI